MKEFRRYKQKQPTAIAYAALNGRACVHNEVLVGR
jgi:hypothetical protein